SSRTLVQQVPTGDHVEGGICRCETSGVEDAHQPAVAHEDVVGDQVAVRHDVPRLTRQRHELSPQNTQGRHVEQSLAAGETGLHPLVMPTDLATPAVALEGPASRWHRTKT